MNDTTCPEPAPDLVAAATRLRAEHPDAETAIAVLAYPDGENTITGLGYDVGEEDSPRSVDLSTVSFTLITALEELGRALGISVEKQLAVYRLSTAGENA